MPVARNLRLLMWFCFWGDFRPYAPIAIIYFAQISGSFALGMSIFAVTRLAQSLLEVPTGVLSDKVGRKHTVVYGAAAGVFALIFYAIGGTYLALFVGAVFEGLGRAFYSGNNDALLHDTLAEMGQRERFAEYLGKTSSMYQTALAISAVIGSLIAAFSFQVALWLSVVPMVLAFVVSLMLVEPQAFTRQSGNVYAHLATAYRNFAKNPRLRTLSLASITSYAISESTWLIRSAFIEKLWPVWAIGIAQLIANAGAAISFYFSGRIIRRFGELRILVGGKVATEATNLFSLLIPTVFSPALMALNSVFFGVTIVATGDLLQREFSDEQRATMGSLNSFVGSIVLAAYSFLLGAMADRIGVIQALVLSSVLSFLPTILYWKVLGRHAGEVGA
jgi:MFS family permease